MSKKVIFTLFLLQLLNCAFLNAQTKDTVLNMVLSKPFFYNLIKTNDNKVLAGTSEGVVEINGVSLEPLNKLSGYVTTDNQGELIIDDKGISHHTEKKFSHLLPYADISREEYHATTSNHFYICSGGRLYIFDLVPYEYSFAYHSIRTISRDFVGTYSGIYFKGKKMESPTPSFTDSYIRQFGDRAFICNYRLQILEKNFLETGRLVPDSNFKFFNSKNNSFINDIYPTSDNKHYYLAAVNQLLLVDSLFTKDSILFELPPKQSPIILIPENKYSLYFTAGSTFYQLDYKTNKINNILSLSEPIKAGIYSDGQCLLLTQKALYRYDFINKPEKLVDIQKAHTILSISGSEFIIGSDLGLYHFDLVSNQLSIIIKGVEFNRMALYKDDNLIYAGSINGLYKIKITDIPILVQQNTSNGQDNINFKNMSFFIGLSILLLVTMGTFLFRYRHKLKVAEKTIEVLKDPTPEVTRDAIEEHIKQNLSKASLKMLQDDFDMSTSQIYIILKPEKPGSIIQRIRLDIFKQMKLEGKSLQEISDATGLSVSYLRKLKA